MENASDLERDNPLLYSLGHSKESPFYRVKSRTFGTMSHEAGALVAASDSTVTGEQPSMVFGEQSVSAPLPAPQTDEASSEEKTAGLQRKKKEESEAQRSGWEVNGNLLVSPVVRAQVQYVLDTVCRASNALATGHFLSGETTAHAQAGPPTQERRVRKLKHTLVEQQREHLHQVGPVEPVLRPGYSDVSGRAVLRLCMSTAGCLSLIIAGGRHR